MDLLCSAGRIFSIGITHERRCDTSFYDLLASSAHVHLRRHPWGKFPLDHVVSLGPSPSRVKKAHPGFVSGSCSST
jgi:hypothetical protein